MFPPIPSGVIWLGVILGAFLLVLMLFGRGGGQKK